MSHVLIVDDEPSICWGFRELLTDDGHEVSIASSAEEALEIASQTIPDAVVLDVRLPGQDGLSAIKDLRQRIGDVPIIVVTAFGNLQTAVRAVEEGAYDYLAKPFDLEQAAEILRRALRRPVPPREFQEVQIGNGDEPAARGTLIGSSLAMQAVFKQIALVATSDVPVLITGESGTGKELVAHAIHAYGRRKAAPFVPICLAALSEGVLESELFGHVRGAFTGADRDRRGLLELADGGTVLLDEIGDVPLPVQVKLLRAIEQREVTPVGHTRPRRSDFRVVAATNRSLAELVAKGEFREDLYYRLGVFHIHLPPLRARTEDIPLLAAHFLRLATVDRRPSRLSKAAVAELVSRPWHGNVRELRNAVERAAVVARGDVVEAEHFPPPSPLLSAANPSAEGQLGRLAAEWAAQQKFDPSETAPGDLYERFLNATEPALLESVLAQCNGNREPPLGFWASTEPRSGKSCGTMAWMTRETARIDGIGSHFWPQGGVVRPFAGLLKSIGGTLRHELLRRFFSDVSRCLNSLARCATRTPQPPPRPPKRGRIPAAKILSRKASRRR